MEVPTEVATEEPAQPPLEEPVNIPEEEPEADEWVIVKLPEEDLATAPSELSGLEAAATTSGETKGVYV